MSGLFSISYKQREMPILRTGHAVGTALKKNANSEKNIVACKPVAK
jgi:hypothetical protein